MINSILNTGLIRLASQHVFPQHLPEERMSSSDGGKRDLLHVFNILSADLGPWT